MGNRANSEQIITGLGTSPLDSLVQQLWRPSVSSGHARVVLDAVPSDRWRTVETYWVLPSVDRPQLLVPRGEPRVTSAALLCYRALRPRKVRLVRSILGLAARLRLPLSLHCLSVQKSNSAVWPDIPPRLPLETISAALGAVQLYAAMGVRLGDNRKATLQLFDLTGSPMGYAKIAWNEASSTFIETEIAALETVVGSSGRTRIPKLIAQGSCNDFPYLVTAPLPSNVRAVRGGVDKPTPQEMFWLTPVNRVDLITSTEHFRMLSRRLAELSSSDQALTAITDQLVRRISDRKAQVPVTERWHGDLVPWNAARELTGQLWCWDWESSEPDVIAGLDALHWAISVRREAKIGTVVDSLLPALEESSDYLRAVGLSPYSWGDLAAVYALVVVERAWTLAVSNGDWSSSWISRGDLIDLLRAADHLVR